MKFSEYFFLYLLFIIISCALAGENYGDLNLSRNNPYAFHMFENFEETQKVFVKEKNFLKNLRQAQQHLKSEAYLIEKMLLKLGEKDYRDSQIDFIEHPLNAFNVLKNHSLVASIFAEIMQHEKRLKETLQEITLTTDDFPIPVDYQSALRGMVVLFDVYHFDVLDLSKGILSTLAVSEGPIKMKSSHGLTAFDIAKLAETAFNRTWYDNAIDLLRPFSSKKNKLAGTENLDNSTRRKIDWLTLNAAEMNNGYLLKRQTLADQNFKVHAYIVDKKLRKKKKQPQFLKTSGLKKANLENYDGIEAHSRSVCGGFSFKGHHGIIDPSLQCHFLHHNDPFMKIGPFKMETVSESPFIAIFHDILTKTEMEHMKETSRPNLSRTRAPRFDANIGQWHEFKKGGKKAKIVDKTVQHWINDINYLFPMTDVTLPDDDKSFEILDPILFKLSKKFELATQLNLTDKYSSSEYQVTNYGLAGLCEAHFDPHGYLEGFDIPPSRKHLIKTGDMLATLMGWISDEPVGGATAFISPYSETLLYPTKGSVAFWLNLDRKGHRDLRTMHSGCPVLKGSKWIMNKWVYVFNQAKRFACSTNQEEFFQHFTKHY